MLNVFKGGKWDSLHEIIFCMGVIRMLCDNRLLTHTHNFSATRLKIKILKKIFFYKISDSVDLKIRYSSQIVACFVKKLENCYKPV